MLKEKGAHGPPETTGGLEPNVKAARYTIVESRIPCLKCHLVTAVFAFALPAGHESLNVDDDTPDDEYGEWEPAPVAAVLSYVEYLPEAVVNRIRAKTLYGSAHRYGSDLLEEPLRALWCANRGRGVA
jgi:hypothetical protein